MALRSEAGWATLAVGFGYGLALKRDGTLWAWGYNYAGQLGLVDDDSRDRPILVGAE